MVEARFQHGADLVRLLDENNFLLRDALWLYNSDEADWKLWLGTPLVDRAGPTEVYAMLRRLLDGHPLDDIDLKRIVIASPKHTLLQLLKGAIKTGPGLNGIRFSRNTINGTYIEDAYIYRLQ
jgi:hypothetical protein